MNTELTLSSKDITEIDEIYSNKQVALANSLIQAREKTSLFESKIELLAIYKVGDEKNVHKKVDADGMEYTVHYVDISAKEIKQLLGSKANNGSMYTYIEAAALELKKKLFIYRDRGSEEFVMKSLYGDVVYRNGRLTIDFNPETEYLFLDLKDNYSKIKLDIAFKFNTIGGLQLYKLLKSTSYSLEIDPELDQNEQQCMQKEYSLSELRLQLGYVDLDQPDIQKESLKPHPDADKISNLEKKPKYRRYNDFYKRVLEPGIKEINEISDIYIESIDKQCSAHGKVDGVVIRIQKNIDYFLKQNKGKKDSAKSKDNVSLLSEEQIDEFIDELRTIIKEDVKTKDLKAIAKEADYDIERIKKAYLVSEKARNIENIVGWLISAIKNQYTSPIPGKKRKNKNAFDNFKSRDYDYDALLKESLSK